MQVQLIFLLFIVYFQEKVFSILYDKRFIKTCQPVESEYEGDEKYENCVEEQMERALRNFVPCINLNCTCHEDVIFNDLRPFKDGITKEMFDRMLSKGTKYQIINGKVYRSEKCHFPARCSGIEHYLTMIAPGMPDMEMVINTRDWPQLSAHEEPAPIFSFSKTVNYHDIMYPAWSFWEGGPAISIYPTGIGRWDKMRKSLMATAEKWPYSEKIGLAFFRGSRTHRERDALVLLSRRYADVADAQYTKNQAYKNSMDHKDRSAWFRHDLTLRMGWEGDVHCVPDSLRHLPMEFDDSEWASPADTLHAPPAPEVTFEEHCKYKILVNYRGVAASFRLKHLFLCNSLVLHAGAEWLEFFYPSLRPWVHYVPLEEPDEESLRRVIQYFLRHEEQARDIAQRGYDHIREHLRDEDVVCYWRRLLQEYAALLNYKVVLDKELVLIQR